MLTQAGFELAPLGYQSLMQSFKVFQDFIDGNVKKETDQPCGLTSNPLTSCHTYN